MSVALPEVVVRGTLQTIMQTVTSSLAYQAIQALPSALPFLNGASRAFASDFTLGASDLVSRYPDVSPMAQDGERWGHRAAAVWGVGEVFLGAAGGLGGGAATLTGVGAVVGVPATAASAAVASHGSVMTGRAMLNMNSPQPPSSGGSGGTNNGGKVQANTLKDFKKLVNKLSHPGPGLTQAELNQFESLARQYGGVLRRDLNPVKGKILQPHVQVEGLGSSVQSRHVWLQPGVQ